MKNISLLLLFITLIYSCSDVDTNRVNEFPISKYKGFKLLKKQSRDAWNDLYVLRNDTIAVQVVVGKCFDSMYQEGDTIK